jgi:hypothetical protein
MPLLDTPDTIICQLSLEGRNLLARAKLGQCTYKALGWQMGRDGYIDTNPVKIKAIVDPATEAVGYIEITSNTFAYGDGINLNGRMYEYRLLLPDWTPGASIPTTVAGIVQKLQDSTDYHHYKMVYPTVDSNPNRIMITSLITGDIGNSFPISTVGSSFSVTPMSGGVSLALGDPAYPVPPTLGDFLDPDGQLELLTVGGARTSASFLMRIPEGPVGMNAFGEVAVWVEVIDSRFSLEIGRRVLFAIGHFPIQAKSDRHIYTQRVVVNF